METTTPLTKESITEDAVIRNGEYPEWGEFNVTGKLRNGVLEIDGEMGGGLLTEDEFDSWQIVEDIPKNE